MEIIKEVHPVRITYPNSFNNSAEIIPIKHEQIIKREMKIIA